MKKIICICMSICICLLTACNGIYYGIRPIDNEHTTWISEDGKMTFYVYNCGPAQGIIDVNGENVPISVYFDRGFGIEIFEIDAADDLLLDSSSERYEVWEWQYVSSKEFIAKVEESTFFEQGDELTFYCVEKRY